MPNSVDGWWILFDDLNGINKVIDCWKYTATIQSTAFLNSDTVTLYSLENNPNKHYHYICISVSPGALTSIASTPAAGVISMVEHRCSTGGTAQQRTIGGPCIVASGTLGTFYTLHTVLWQHNNYWSITDSWRVDVPTTVYYQWFLFNLVDTENLHIYSPAATTAPLTQSDKVQASATHRLPTPHILPRITVYRYFQCTYSFVLREKWRYLH